MAQPRTNHGITPPSTLPPGWHPVCGVGGPLSLHRRSESAGLAFRISQPQIPNQPASRSESASPRFRISRPHVPNQPAPRSESAGALRRRPLVFPLRRKRCHWPGRASQPPLRFRGGLATRLRSSHPAIDSFSGGVVPGVRDTPRVGAWAAPPGAVTPLGQTRVLAPPPRPA